MPKMQVYLADELYARVKARGAVLNVSGVLQSALGKELAELDRQDALAEAVRSYEGECGAFSEEELEIQRAADVAAGRRVGAFPG